MKKLIVCLIGSFAVTSFAALPPYWERSREMSDILSQSGIAEIVENENRSSQMVDTLRFKEETETGLTYEIVSGKCSMLVYLAYKETGGIVGPAQYDLSWQQSMTCER